MEFARANYVADLREAQEGPWMQIVPTKASSHRERCEGGLAECTQSEGRGRWDCDWHCKTVTGSGRSTD